MVNVSLTTAVAQQTLTRISEYKCAYLHLMQTKQSQSKGCLLTSGMELLNQEEENFYQNSAWVLLTNAMIVDY